VSIAEVGTILNLVNKGGRGWRANDRSAALVAAAERGERAHSIFVFLDDLHYLEKKGQPVFLDMLFSCGTNSKIPGSPEEPEQMLTARGDKRLSLIFD
jgi:hypothetical protein